MIRYVPDITGDIYKINDDPNALVFFRADDDTFYLCCLYIDDPSESRSYIMLDEDIYYSLLVENDNYVQIYVSSLDEMLAIMNSIDLDIWMRDKTVADILHLKK